MLNKINDAIFLPEIYLKKLSRFRKHFVKYFDGLVQDYSMSIAYSLEILQSCIKPSISSFAILSRLMREL